MLFTKLSRNHSVGCPFALWLGPYPVHAWRSFADDPPLRSILREQKHVKFSEELHQEHLIHTDHPNATLRDVKNKRPTNSSSGPKDVK
uniref:Uncharacterized protein n=1 Tax=Acrobeloides nanus TaxID=290746 RepID=A0A914D7W4_9BILA